MKNFSFRNIVKNDSQLEDLKECSLCESCISLDWTYNKARDMWRLDVSAIVGDTKISLYADLVAEYGNLGCIALWEEIIVPYSWAMLRKRPVSIKELVHAYEYPFD